MKKNTTSLLEAIARLSYQAAEAKRKNIMEPEVRKDYVYQDMSYKKFLTAAEAVK